MSLKEGKYQCVVLAPFNGWFGESGEKNTPFIRLNLRVIEDGEAEGDELEWQGWLSEKALARTCKNLAEVFGWDGDLEALAGQLKTGPFVGKPCSVVTEFEEYNGKKRIKIKWLNSAGGGGKTLPATEAMALAKRLNASAKMAASEADAPAPKKRATDPDIDAEADDIPF